MNSATAASAASLRVCALAAMGCFASAFAQQQEKYNHPAADPNHDLTVKEFFADIGGNFKGLVSVHSIAPVLGGGAAYGFATIPEQRIEAHFAPGDVWGAWSTPGKYIGHPLVVGGASLALFGASRKSEDRRFRSFSYALVQGMIMSSAIVLPTKEIFRRSRPSGDDSFSAFPSGHSTDSFMVATIVAEHYGWKAAVPAYAVATYVAMTRLEERKHHLTDVTAGAAIGYLVGRTVSRRLRNGPGKKVTWQIYPSRRGFLGMVSIQLP